MLVTRPDTGRKPDQVSDKWQWQHGDRYVASQGEKFVEWRKGGWNRDEGGKM